MAQERFSLYVEQFGTAAGQRMGVLRARAQSGLPLFGASAIVPIQSFAPEYEALRREGFTPSSHIEAEFFDLDLTLVQITRSKVETQMLVARAWAATRVGGRIIVDGQKTDGIESIFKSLRKAGITPDGLVKAHGRLFWFERTDQSPLDAWLHPGLKSPAGFVTAPGVFSAEKIDKGSQVLLDHLPPLTGAGADFGAGWGFLARQMLQSDKLTQLTLIEAEATALDAARKNISDARASFEWADVTRVSGRAYDFIVANPPFHTERAANTDLGVAFMTAAARNLKPKGQFFCVANRHLPYEAALTQLFRSANEIGGNAAFKVFHASQPRRL